METKLHIDLTSLSIEKSPHNKHLLELDYFLNSDITKECCTSKFKLYNISSSWIDKLGYNSSTKQIVFFSKKQKMYYNGISKNEFEDLLNSDNLYKEWESFFQTREQAIIHIEI